MRSLRTLLVPAAATALAAGCLGGGDSPSGRPDASAPGIPDASGGGNGEPPPDAAPPPSFDTLELQLIPETPRPGFEFTLYIRAADDDGRLYRGYDGVVSIEDSSGELLGLTESLQVSGGTLFVPLTYENELADVTLTVTDEDDAAITATTEPFNVEFEGAKAELGDVVISEVNWFGSGSFLEEHFEVQDNWIEIRNVSGEELNLAQWTIQNAAPEGNDVAIDSGTVVPDGGYLLLAMLRGDATFPSSLAGLPNVQLQPVALPDEGVELVLLDVEDTVIDRTPDSNGDGWAAGNSETMLSMERIEDPDSGYGDGSQVDQWQTFNPSDTSTTFAGTFDEGTPGADSSDQDAASSLPMETSFEVSQAKFELHPDAAGQKLDFPPAGIAPRTGGRVLSTDRLVHNSFSSRALRTLECFEVEDDKLLALAVHATASEENENEPDALGLRHAVEWYTDSRCETPLGVSRTSGARVDFNEGEYKEILDDIAVESGATHAKLLIEAIRNVSGDIDDAWAADDYSVELIDPPPGSPD